MAGASVYTPAVWQPLVSAVFMAAIGLYSRPHASDEPSLAGLLGSGDTVLKPAAAPQLIMIEPAR
jgi:hypothetical protein